MRKLGVPRKDRIFGVYHEEYDSRFHVGMEEQIDAEVWNHLWDNLYVLLRDYLEEIAIPLRDYLGELSDG